MKSGIVCKWGELLISDLTLSYQNALCLEHGCQFLFCKFMTIYVSHLFVSTWWTWGLRRNSCVTGDTAFSHRAQKQGSHLWPPFCLTCSRTGPCMFSSLEVNLLWELWPLFAQQLSHISIHSQEHFIYLTSAQNPVFQICPRVISCSEIYFILTLSSGDFSETLHVSVLC